MFELDKISKYRNVIYGIAMIWIILFHCYETFGTYLNDIPGTFSTVFRYGTMGVDVFLFLSGMSMYYAMRSTIKRNENIWNFYGKRISKIAKIYILICIPFLLYEYLTGKFSIITFQKQLFFCDQKVSMFWFLACIGLCYLIYPFIYRTIEAKKEYIPVLLLIVYILFLGFLSIRYPDLYTKYEIMLGRFPIFIVGSLFGPKIYNHQKMNPYCFLLFIFSLILRGPVFMIIHHSAFLMRIETLLFRLSLGIQAIGVILLLVLMIEKIEGTRVYSFLKWIGTFTLETYVIHIIIRKYLTENTPLIPGNTTEAILWAILFLIFSIIISYVVFQAGKRLNFQRINKKEYLK